MARGNPIFHARIERTLYARLLRYASETNQTFSDIVRNALSLYIVFNDVPDYAPDPVAGQLQLDDLQGLQE